MTSNSKFKQLFKMTPAKMILLTFFGLILVGSFLLCLPVSRADGEWTPYIDALFSSTSSVCVTGLMTIDIASELSLFGEFVTLILIQVGGLGFVTMTAFVFMIIGKKINYQTRITLQEAFNKDENSGVVKTVIHVLIITGVCELLGFFALAPSMIEFSGDFWSGCFKALFLSVSAFCNAGIDPLGRGTADFSNLSFFVGNPFVLIPVMCLIVLGGIGFVVILDIVNRPKKNKKLSLHTKIVLWMTLILILFGAFVFMAAEWNNKATIGNLGTFDKVVNSFFQSITTRTAGFTTIDQSAMTDISFMVSTFLMFIGGSPVSIAGGIKTTTFFVILLFISKNQDQNGNIIYKSKRISQKVLSKALKITLIAASLLLVGTALVFVFEGGDCSIDSVIYEVMSAICTVGLSFGITSSLSVVSKLTLIILMYIGRIGMLTIPLAFKTKETGTAIEYANAKIIVG